jgi:hypothetical protein
LLIEFFMSSNTPDFSKFDEIITQAEENLQNGLNSLSSLSNQAREVFETNPGAILTSIAVAGFAAGVMMRRRSAGRRKTRSQFAADPLVLFVAGAVAGLAVGPQIVEEFTEGTKSFDQSLNKIPRH